MISDESILNDREVIRALQFAIDHLKRHLPAELPAPTIEDGDIQAVIKLFIEQDRRPTVNNLTHFFLGSRQFKNQALLSNNLYGIFEGTYTKGQLIDFFQKYLQKSPSTPAATHHSDEIANIDFFEKETFNRLTENGIQQLKSKIAALGILKTEDLSEYVQRARETFPRAYEHWSKEEKELLRKAIHYTNDLNLLSECFQRGKGSIETTAKRIMQTT